MLATMLGSMVEGVCIKLLDDRPGGSGKGLCLSAALQPVTQPGRRPFRAYQVVTVATSPIHAKVAAKFCT
jgi:hypothetical protein